MDAKTSSMYQIVFNEISAAEMARIPKELQLELLAEFQFLRTISIVWIPRLSV